MTGNDGKSVEFTSIQLQIKSRANTEGKKAERLKILDYGLSRQRRDARRKFYSLLAQLYMDIFLLLSTFSTIPSSKTHSLAELSLVDISFTTPPHQFHPKTSSNNPVSLMNRTTSIVPRGFEISAHPVFLSYQIPEIRSVCIETREMLVEKNNDETVENEMEEKETQQHCPICLRHFEDPVTMVECQHTFCVECINIWFQTVCKCPICNTESSDYVESSDNSNEEETSSNHTLTTRTWKLWSTSSTSIVSLDKETAILAMKKHTLMLQNQKKQGKAESAIQLEKKRKVISTESGSTQTEARKTENKKKKKKRRKQNP